MWLWGEFRGLIMESGNNRSRIKWDFNSFNLNPIFRLSYLLVPLVIFFAFAKLGNQPIHQWDEARTGINAIEMLQNGDWINLYFGGEPDKIRAKPPLVIWWVATNFSILGYNTFALRLHSAIASVFIFLLVYKIIRLYKSPLFAAGVILILLSVRGILGFHVGRTGDFDAVLLAFLLAGLYAFLLYLEFDKPKAIYWAALAWGFAFLTKGPAMGILFPGIFLYLLLTKKLSWILKQRAIYFAGALCLLFPISWYLILYFFGVQLENPEVSGKNAFERMFLYDLKDRFTQTEFEGKTEQRDPLFLIHYLAENFAYWNYLFFTVFIGGLYLWLKNRMRWSFIEAQKLLLLSLSIWLSLGFFLSLVTVAKFWYFAPALPFVAITLMYGIEWTYLQKPWVITVFLGLWMTTMYFRYFGPKPQATAGSKEDDFFTALIQENQSLIENMDSILVVGELPEQRVLLELYFTNPNLVYSDRNPNLEYLPEGSLFFYRVDEWIENELVTADAANIFADKNYGILARDQE